MHLLIEPIPAPQVWGLDMFQNAFLRKVIRGIYHTMCYEKNPAGPKTAPCDQAH